MNLYVSSTQLISSLPINDETWHKVLAISLPALSSSQIVSVQAEQEVTSASTYLTYVGATVTYAGNYVTASMATDIESGNHAAIHRGGAIQASTSPSEVAMWIWGGSVYGNAPLTVEQTGYGRLSVIVS